MLTDTFTGWVKAFSTSSEKAAEVCKSLPKEIIIHFELPESLQSANGPFFIAKVTQSLLTTLGITVNHMPPGVPSLQERLKR